VRPSQPCSTCGGEEILRVPGAFGAQSAAIPVGLTAVPVTRYVCATCGRVDHFVDDDADLARLRKKYRTVR
jgi:hypothetical protein